MQLKDAIGSFFVEFSRFETHAVGLALRSLSRDPIFVQHAEHLLDFEARLKLLERMAFARDVPASLMGELEACLLRARKLREQRDEVARTLADVAHSRPSPPTKIRASSRRNADLSRLAALESLWMPAAAQIEEYTKEALDLQKALRMITEKLERQLSEAAA